MNMKVTLTPDPDNFPSLLSTPTKPEEPLEELA